MSTGDERCGTFPRVSLAARSLDAASTGTAWLLVVHLLATAAMVGIIWFVQVVHYPLFTHVGSDGFVEYELRNTHLTSFVVGPFMAVEGVTAMWLAVRPPDGVPQGWAILGLGLLAVVLGSTVLVQVADHSALSEAYSPERARRLVRFNWVRTIGWSARGVLAAWLAVHTLQA
jgi:uncharacterized membrane protein